MIFCPKNPLSFAWLFQHFLISSAEKNASQEIGNSLLDKSPNQQTTK
jgi:hypothetical protein